MILSFFIGFKINFNIRNLKIVIDILIEIFITASLHRSSDISIMLKEVYRVLKPAGRLILINESVEGFKSIKLDCAEVRKNIDYDW